MSENSKETGTPGPWYAYHIEGGIRREGYSPDGSDDDTAIVITNRPEEEFLQDGNPGDRVAFVLTNDDPVAARWDADLMADAPQMFDLICKWAKIFKKLDKKKLSDDDRDAVKEAIFVAKKEGYL